MSNETLQQMEHRWHLMMAATDSRTGQRITDRDPKYAREAQALRVEIETRRAAEVARPQISQQQIAQLEWLDRAQGATDKSGQRLYQPGTKWAHNLETVRAKAVAGEDITANIASAERVLAEQGGEMPITVPRPPTGRGLDGNETGYKVLIPTVAATPTIAQAINTQRSQKA